MYIYIDIKTQVTSRVQGGHREKEREKRKHLLKGQRPMRPTRLAEPP